MKFYPLIYSHNIKIIPNQKKPCILGLLIAWIAKIWERATQLLRFLTILFNYSYIENIHFQCIQNVPMFTDFINERRLFPLHSFYTMKHQTQYISISCILAENGEYKWEHCLEGIFWTGYYKENAYYLKKKRVSKILGLQNGQAMGFIA